MTFVKWNRHKSECCSLQASDSSRQSFKVISKEESPFLNGYESLVQTSEWNKEAIAFETRLGIFASNDSRANKSTKQGLRKMTDIFTTVYGDEKHQEEHLKPFGIEGTDVNLIERMTAFYNVAYFGKGFGNYAALKPSLKEILHEIVFEKGDDASSKTGIQDKMELSS